MQKQNGKGDVALFIDWENIKASLDERGLKPNVSSMRETAESFGRLAYRVHLSTGDCDAAGWSAAG